MVRKFLQAIIVMSCVQNLYGSQDENLRVLIGQEQQSPANQHPLDESYEAMVEEEFDNYFAGGSNQQGNNSDTEEVDYDQKSDDEQSGNEFVGR